MKPEKKTYYYAEGRIEYEEWLLDGKTHRTDGPAIIHYREDGSVRFRGWFLRDKLHRVDGPAWAHYYENGSVEDEEWWVDGVRLEDL